MQRTILSVCNYELHADRDYSTNGVTAFKHHFHIPASEKGEYKLLTVGDLWDRFHTTDKMFSSVPVYGEHIAQDLVDEWTGNYMTAGSPGVIVLKGETPTPQEIELATQQHVNYCTARRNEAARLWAENKKSEAMTDLYRLASVYLGSPDDPWCLSQNRPIQVKCQWCGTGIDADAAICAHCGKVANFGRYQELLKQQQEIEDRFRQAPPLAAVKPVAPPIAPPVAPVPAARN